MMFFFVLMCTDVDYSIHCLPMQKMQSERARIIAEPRYKRLVPDYVRTRRMV